MYVPEGKDPNLAPRPLDGEEVSQVQMKLVLDSVKLIGNKLDLSIAIRLTWKDPDITLYNLQSDPLANIVDVETLQEIWIPTVST